MLRVLVSPVLRPGEKSGLVVAVRIMLLESIARMGVATTRGEILLAIK